MKNETMTQEILFVEKQRFSQWWIWLLLGSFTFVLGYIFAQEVKNGANFNDLITTGNLIIWLLFLLLTFALFYFSQLKTTITKEGIIISFFPFLRKKMYGWEDIEKAYTRTYSPIWEYGGWGIRYGFKNGMAYNISGKEGLQLVLKNGKKILIGSKKVVAINRILEENKFSNQK